MSKRLLIPIDLSPNSLSVLDFATQLAKQKKAMLCFVYVAPPIHPNDAMLGAEYDQRYIETVEQEFNQLRPTDDSVEYEHIFRRGNPGPTIVAETKTADLCVLSTHGRSAFMRLMMGSVAQYVLRYANCPVVMVKGLIGSDCETAHVQESGRFVTEVMDQVSPIHEHDRMETVLAQLIKAGETGAPVVNSLGHCIGILTTTDIQKYHELLARHQAHDQTVVSEMFETDKYGHVRCDNDGFDQVKRHMTEAVISVGTSDSIDTAIEAFEAHPEIHHLVVVDENDQPVGVIDSAQVIKLKLPLQREVSK